MNKVARFRASGKRTEPTVVAAVEVQRRGALIVAACPYCGQVHVHPAANLGTLLRCPELDASADLAYLAVRTRRRVVRPHVLRAGRAAA